MFCSAACRARQWRRSCRLRERVAAELNGEGVTKCPVCEAS